MQLEVHGLTRRYGATPALDGVSFTLPPGRIVVLLGLNGAGKTTLLRCLATVSAPDRGRILIDGEPLTRGHLKLRQRLGFLPDFPYFYREMTVVEHVAMCLRLYGKDGAGIEERVGELLQDFDLLPLIDTPMGRLSRGQAYKAALAALLAVDPDLWLLDEPFASGMDPRGIQAFRARAREAAAWGRTILYSTQLIEVAQGFADLYCVIHRGRLHAFDSRVRSAMGAFDGARNDLDRAVKLAPGCPDPWVWRIRVALEAGRPDEALGYLPRLEALKPPIGYLLQMKGRALSVAGNAPEGDECLRRAVDAAGTTAGEVHRIWGVARACRGDLDAAVMSFDAALASTPNPNASLIWRSVTNLARHDPQAAAADARRILETSDWREPHVMDAAILLHLSGEGGTVLDAAAAHCEDDRWPLPLIQCLRGTISVGELLDAARGVGQETWARAVVAWALVAAGEREAARPHVDWLCARPPGIDSGLVLACALRGGERPGGD